MDPRVKTSVNDLTLQFSLSRSVDSLMSRLVSARADVLSRAGRATGDAATAFQQLAADLQAAYAPLPALFDLLQEADVKPTPVVEAAVTDAVKQANAVLARVPG
jgi:hypothetical protein